MLTITTGRRKGKKFPDLTAYLRDQERRQARCKHSKTQFSYIITGINAKTQHLSAGCRCLVCGKVLDSVRVKISREEAERLYPGCPTPGEEFSEEFSEDYNPN